MKKIIIFRIASMEMGGVPKVMLNQIEHLDRSKYDIIVLLNINQGELLNDIPHDVKVIYMAKGKQQMSNNKIMLHFELLWRKLVLVLYYLFPKILLRKIKPVPHLEISMDYRSLTLLIRSPFRNSKKVNWFHSDIRFFPKRFARKLAIRMGKCDIVIFCSHATLLNFERHLQTRILNSTIIYNAFDVSRIKERAQEILPEKYNILFEGKKNIFLSIGRLSYQKGYDVLIEAHAELIEEGIEHTIIVIGGGNEYDNFIRKVKELSIEGSFLFLGTKENPYPFLSRANFYIQPSRYESYPLSVCESLVLNKPMICTDVAGIREILINNKMGYIVDFSKDSLKYAIKEFLSNPKCVSRIRTAQKDFDFMLHNRNVYNKFESIV